MAAPGARVQVKGAKELRRAMKVAGDDLKDWTRVHKEAAQPVLKAAQDGAPRLSGELAASHRVRAGKASAKVTAGSASVPYAGPIHFGWPSRNIAENPWLWTAADRYADDAIAVYEAEVEKLVRKVDRMTPG